MPSRVVDRDCELHLHLRGGHGLRFSVRNFPLRFEPGNEFEIADNASLISQTKRLGLCFQAKFGNAQINPISQCFRFDVSHTADGTRQRRKGIGHIIVDFGAPQPHEPGQLLFGPGSIQACLGKLSGEFGIECLFTGLPGCVERAGLTQSHRQFRSGVRRRFRTAEITHSLEGGDGIDPCLPRLIGQCECVVHGAQLSLPEVCVCNGRTLLARGGIEHVRPDQSLDRPVGTQFGRTDAQYTNRHDRVFRRRLLPGLCGRQANVRVGRLQPFVVQKRDLNGGVRRNGLAVHHRVHLLLQGLVFGLGFGEGCPFADGWCDLAGNVGEASFGSV